MKTAFIILTAVLATISLTRQLSAQARTPAQEFFEQGWRELEQQIQILQGEQRNSEENSQQQESEPLLQVNPSASPEANPTPNEVESPSQRPDDQRNNIREN
ncbi:MAG TPA: hypothetical protein DCL61_31895 [Cyanobacteria bacterium UBA12227]|nr:hypothetical protein [Cyanobacteria bacterium UBA12227]HAX89882.1 hypothetical protein [Cyanobacteria bacterium UBA11370]HBY76042.1 hypothetical protein [Cyanobacteria bacterium UBA11148]